MKNTHKIGEIIYIVSDETFTSSKDWFIDIKDNRNQLHQVGYDLEDNGWTEQYEPEYFKKIILSTDKNLIKNGVQAIDDEFLEWFEKNPSCEEVKVIKQELNTDYRSDWKQKFYYKIIIPKENPKQETTNQTYENGEPLTYWGGLDCERSYSEEEVIYLNLSYSRYLGSNQGSWVSFKEWFNLNKKK